MLCSKSRQEECFTNQVAVARPGHPSSHVPGSGLEGRWSMTPCLRSIPHTVPDVPPPCGLTKDTVIFARPAAVRWTAVVLAPVPVAGETSILLQGCATYLFVSLGCFLS